MNTPSAYLRLLTLVFGLSSSLPMFAQTAESATAATPTAPAAQPDFGDHSSETLTTKAWEALTSKNYALVDAYTSRCIELYADKAAEMQAKLTNFAPTETASTLWALNDVGTCYYIRGQAFEAQGKNKEALAAYRKLVDDFGFAQTWDTKGWFWQPAGAAKQRVQVLEFDTL